MLTRYKTAENGNHAKIADLYTPEEHGITPAMLDSDALKVANRLASNGYEAYIVGGAVRDLLIGRVPKDFDIATDALPKQVRKLFRNSRIIGKRFRLVHVHFGDKIIEVSTFRSNAPGAENNVYGALEEDVRRRDFSLNALYYSPRTRYVIDFVGAFDDIKNGRMRSLLPLEETFKEDPVRLLRAVKYSVMTGFSLPRKLKVAIRKDAEELRKSSISRLTEELFKILQSGHAAGILKEIQNLDLLDYLLPEISEKLKERSGKNLQKIFFQQLEDLDAYVSENSEINRGLVLSYVLQPFVISPLPEMEITELVDYIFSEAKKIFLPLTPPNKEIEKAVRTILRKRGKKIPSRRRKKKEPPSRR